MRCFILDKSKLKNLWELFFSMLYISAFTFGGGFVIITFMKRKFVDKLHWIDEEEMLELTALAQSSPGAIAVNAAILVGWRIGGFFGMVVAVLGTIIPPIIIISIISVFYSIFASNTYIAMALKGMQSGVAAVIVDVALSMGGKIVKTKSAVNIIVMALAFVATFFFNVNVIFIILFAAAVGIVSALIKKRGDTK